MAKNKPSLLPLKGALKRNSIMGAMSKRKGASGEREAAAELNRLFGVECHRGRQYHGGPDSPDIAGFPGLHIEVKRSQTFNAYAAMEQAKADAPDGVVPVVLHRRNGKKWLLIAELDDMPLLSTVLYLTAALNTTKQEEPTE